MAGSKHESLPEILPTKVSPEDPAWLMTGPSVRIQQWGCSLVTKTPIRAKAAHNDLGFLTSQPLEPWNCGPGRYRAVHNTVSDSSTECEVSKMIPEMIRPGSVWPTGMQGPTQGSDSDEPKLRRRSTNANPHPSFSTGGFNIKRLRERKCRAESII